MCQLVLVTYHSWPIPNLRLSWVANYLLTYLSARYVLDSCIPSSKAQKNFLILFNIAMCPFDDILMCIVLNSQIPFWSFLILYTREGGSRFDAYNGAIVYADSQSEPFFARWNTFSSFFVAPGSFWATFLSLFHFTNTLNYHDKIIAWPFLILYPV